MNRKHLAGTLATGAALGLALVTPAVIPAVSSADTASSGSLPGSFLLSNLPKTVELDPTTGAVLSVYSGEPAGLDTGGPDISSGTDCATGDGCYYTPIVNGTYHDRSFYGSPGTFTGSWPRRNAWDSGDYTASVCWQSACSNTVGPNTYVTFGGSLVTGTSFTIY